MVRKGVGRGLWCDSWGLGDELLGEGKEELTGAEGVEGETH